MNIKTLFGRNLPVAGPIAPRVAAELATVEGDLQTLEARRGDLALAVATGEPDAETAMDSYRADVEVLRYRVSDLRAALAVAQGQDAAAEVRKRANVHAGQVNAVRQHLSKRESAAIRLQSALVNADAALRDLDAINGKVLAALPTGHAVQLGDAVLYFPQLRTAVAEEIFRVGAGPRSSSGGFPNVFPGAQAPSVSADPAAMISLSEKLKADGKYLVSILEGSVAKPAPVEMVPAVDPLPIVEGVEGETAGVAPERPAEYDPADLGERVVFTGPAKVALL